MNLQNLVDYCQWQGIDIFENCSVPAPLDIEMVKNELHSTFASLTSEEQKFANIFLVDIESGKVKLSSYKPVSKDISRE